MSGSQEEARQLSWLQDAWRKQAAKIDHMSRRWADLKASPEAAPGLRQKLAHMLDQIAFFQTQERAIVNEIEEMEKKHKFMRQHNLLKRAEDRHIQPQTKPQPQLADEDRKPDKDGLWAALAAGWLWKRLFTSPDDKLDLSGR